MPKQQWVVTVDDEHLSRLSSIAAELEAAGLTVDRVLKSLGQITGSADIDDDAAATFRSTLASTDGVVSVDNSQQYRINSAEQ